MRRYEPQEKGVKILWKTAVTMPNERNQRLRRPVSEALSDTKALIEQNLLAGSEDVVRRFQKDRTLWEIHWEELLDIRGELSW
jgi:hypothetical protein